MHVRVHVHVRLRLLERGEKVLQVVGLRLAMVPNMLVHRIPQRLQVPLIALRLPGPFCAALFEDMRTKHLVRVGAGLRGGGSLRRSRAAAHVPVTLGTAMPPVRVMNQRGDQPRVQLEAAREERLGARPFADALCKQAVVATEEELREQELQRAGHESCSPVFHTVRTGAAVRTAT